MQALVEVDLSDDDGAPIAGLGEEAAVLAVNAGDHPVLFRIGVRAADHVDVVLAGAGGGEEGLQPMTGNAITSAPRLLSSRATSGKKPS